MDAFIADHRVRTIIKLINYLFYIERVANFSHIAMGRRNWGKAGSHKAAENLAFMYSLYESCKMNNLNFGRYIEDILTRMKDGDKDYKSMLPCYYVEKSDALKECA